MGQNKQKNLIFTCLITSGSYITLKNKEIHSGHNLPWDKAHL